MGSRDSFAAVMVSSWALAGCLFPSFDELRAHEGGSPNRTVVEPTAALADPHADEPGPSGSAPDASPPPQEDAGDTATTVKPSIVKLATCGTETFDPRSSLCCLQLAGVSVRPRSASVIDCGAVIRCQGNDDCSNGERCCLDAAGSSCSVGACSAFNACRPGESDCPSATTCSAEIKYSFSVAEHVCR